MPNIFNVMAMIALCLFRLPRIVADPVADVRIRCSIHPSPTQTTMYLLIGVCRLLLSRPVAFLQSISNASRHHAYNFRKAALHYNMF
jgi:hypothetical protein